MKLLIVCSEYFNSSNGLSISTQRFVKEFRKLGDDVRILASDNGGTPDYSVSIMNIPLVDDIMDKQNFHFAEPNFKVAREAIEWADLIHIEDPFPLSVVVAKLANRMGVPITGTFHLYPENMTASVPIFDFSLSNRNIMNVFRRNVYKYCAAIQCPTEKVKKRLEECGYKSKLVVISNGIPSEYIAEEPSDEHNDVFTLISVGRYSNEKDQITLIKALKESAHAEQIQLILAGRGPKEDMYRTMGDSLPLKPIMRFYSQEELHSEVRKADLYVHCANVEIEGMACMEAFAAGTVPIIADSKLSSTSVYALTDKNIYSAGDSVDLAAKIDYWFENRIELSDMSRRYIALAHTLSIEESAKKVHEMMLSVLEK